MGRDAAKACENQCFRCRKEAAKHNDKLGSREGAAELLGISVSSLADGMKGERLYDADYEARRIDGRFCPAGC